MAIEREIHRELGYTYLEDPSATSINLDVLRSIYSGSGDRKRSTDQVLPEQSDKAHIRRSRNIIEQTAGRSVSQIPEGVTKKAIILGSGHCRDIPLKALLPIFDKITLVELFAKRTKGAVDSLELTPAQKEKITIVRADITGTVAGLVDGLASAEEEFPEDPYRFSIGMRKAFKDAQTIRDTPDLGSGYHFVSSQLLMSELDTISTMQVDKIVHETFGKEDIEDMPGGRTNQAFVQEGIFQDILHQKHLQKLREVVAPDGLVHFADTTFGPNTQLLRHSEGLFTVEEGNPWKWQVQNDTTWAVYPYVLTPISS